MAGGRVIVGLREPPTLTPMSGFAETAGPRRARAIPAPGEAPLPAPNAAALIRRHLEERGDRPAIHFGGEYWTYAGFHREASRFANLFLALRPAEGPFHVAVLLDNTPDYLFAFGGAALAGATIVGLNHTRQGEHLLRDVTHTDCSVLITETRHQADVAPLVGEAGIQADRVLVSSRFADPDEGEIRLGRSLTAALDEVDHRDPGLEPDVATHWALIFTSGTSSAPKAVICSQRRLLGSGTRLGMVMGIGPDDVGYVCMPLFHSNALMVGWAPALVNGASVGLARKFSASRWLPDVRRYRATYFNYTGKPLSYLLATPEQPDDADNTLRVAYGNEGSPQVVAEFSRRFGVQVIDAFGATEGGIAVDRDAPPKPGALGRVGPNVKIVDDDGADKPRAAFDEHGRLINAEECVGEIVNTAGAGPFEGYYNNAEATERTTRGGWFWSGDLGYLDDDGYLYFAGRNAEWIRVDGENFPAAPIEQAIGRHPDVVIAAVYGVADEQAGDQTMASLILREGAAFDGAALASWLDGLADIGPKWRPRYVRVATELPTTGTNKVVKRTLVHQKFRSDRVGGDAVWVRERGDAAYRPFTAADEAVLRQRFIDAGRERFWDL